VEVEAALILKHQEVVDQEVALAEKIMQKVEQEELQIRVFLVEIELLQDLVAVVVVPQQ
jgi:hypothetical protein